jgi:glyoxylate/hydroxypyruvate reductase A
VLQKFPALQAIFSVNAGVEALLNEPTTPRDVPLVRMVDPGLTAGMVEWVAGRVLDLHRNGPLYRAQQRERTWRQLPEKLAPERKVGVLGLGELGGSAARLLAQLGFDVQGWSRTQRRIDGVTVQTGADGLDAVLAQAEILVNLLPFTPQTEGLLDRTAFARMQRGAWLINAARGRHVVDADLVAALDEGRLAGAVLDVFAVEPLPQDHPFWSHPRIEVTPHVAAITHARTAAKAIADNLTGFLAGRKLQHVVDWSRGY